MDRLALQAWRNYSALNDHFFTLAHMEEGAEVEVGLLGLRLDDVQLGVDASLRGILEDGSHNIIRLTDTDCPDLDDSVGRQIGLSVNANLGTPGGPVLVTLRSCIRKNGEMAYYFPEEVAVGDYPGDGQFRMPMATYGRLSVAGAVLFDHRDDSFLFK